MRCKARQYSDQMMCGACGLAWDVNDPDRPKCKTEKDRSLEWIKKLRGLSTRREKKEG